MVNSNEDKNIDAKLSDASKFLETLSTTRKVKTQYAIPREIFDPTNVEHLKSYRTFLKTGSWGSNHFHVEYPYNTVAETVFRKFAGAMLEEKLKGVE